MSYKDRGLLLYDLASQKNFFDLKNTVSRHFELASDVAELFRSSACFQALRRDAVVRRVGIGIHPDSIHRCLAIRRADAVTSFRHTGSVPLLYSLTVRPPDVR